MTTATLTDAEWSEIWHAAGNGVARLGAAQPVIERIIAARVAEAHRADAEMWSTAIGKLEELASEWLRRDTAYPDALMRTSAAAQRLRAILRGEP